MWNRNRGGNASGGGRPLPHVISGHAGYKEGGSGVQAAESSGRDEKLTLGNWVASAVDERDDQRKRLVTFETVREMFEGLLDAEVVQMVLSACDWQDDKAVEQLLELTTDSRVSFSEGRDSRHTLDGIASWLGGGKSQCGIPGWDVTGTGNSSRSDPVVCAKEKTDSAAASSNSSRISYLEAARNFASCRSAENRSISELRDFNSANISQQNSPKQSLSARRQLFPDTGRAMANNKASSQGLNNSRVSVDPGWPIDKDKVYFSDDEKEEEAGVKIPSELDCRTALVNTSPYQYSHLNPVDSNLRTLNPWASVYSPFNRSAVPYNAYSLSADGSFISGFQKPGDQRNSYLDDFVMPRLPVQMSSQYSPNESRIFTPPKANAAQKQDAWLSSAAVQNTVSPHAVRNTASPHQIYRFPTVNSACALSVEAKTTAAPESNADITVLSAIAAKSKVLQLLHSHKVLVLLRGCPGSGKSTLAKQIKFNGIILSADSYFERNGKYEYDVSKIGDAHGWCKNQALRAMKNNINPVIIDNTNTQAWEMLPYVEMAVDCGYRVEVIEPDVPWRLKAKELAKFNSHGVPANKLQSMLSRYQCSITGRSLLDAVIKKRQMAPQSSTFSLDMRNTLSAQVHGNGKDEDSAKLELEKLDRKRRNRRKKKLIGKDDDDPAAKENEKEKLLEANNYGNNQEVDKSCDVSQFHDAKHDLIAFDSMQHFSGSMNSSVLQYPPDLCSIETCRSPDFQDSSAETKATAGFNLRTEKALILEKLQAVYFDSHDSGNAAAHLSSCPTDNAASENAARAAGVAGTAGRAASDDEKILPISDFLENDSGPDVEILDELELELEDPAGEPYQRDASVESSLQSLDSEQPQTAGSCTERNSSEMSCLNLQKETGTHFPVADTCLTESLSCTWNQLPTETKNSTELSYWSSCESQSDSYMIGVKVGVKSSTILDGDHTWPECDISEEQTDSRISRSDEKQTPLGTEQKSEPLQQDMMSSASEREPADTQLNDLKWEIPSFGQSPSYSKKCLSLPQKSVSIDALTQTEARDLTAVYRLENDPSYRDETFSRTLPARPRVIFDRELSILSQLLLDTKISLVSKLDESTMTDESLGSDVCSKIEFLSECFPTVLGDDLQFLLSSCGNDADMAVNTLLDSGYEYNEPRRRAPDSSVETPAVAAVAVEVEELESAVQSNERVRLSRQSRRPVSYKLYQDFVKPNLLSSEFELHRRRDFRTRKTGKDQPLKSQRVGACEQRPSESKLVLSLAPTFAAQLVELFGPVGCSKPSGLMSEVDLSINISMELAQQIHAAWAASHNLCCDEGSASFDWSSGVVEIPSQRVLKTSTNPVSLSQFSGKMNDFPQFLSPPQSSAPVLPDPEASSLSTKIKRQKLKDRYPTINSTIIDEIFEATGYSYDVTVKTIDASPELIAPAKVVMTKRKSEEMELELIERAIAESLKDQYANRLSDNGRFINCDEVYEGLMDEAAACFKRYQENLQQAQKAHCKKMHPVAMHYSEVATRWKEKLQEAKLVAAEMIMQTRLSDLSNLSSIDLHGLSVQEALCLLEKSLSQRENDLLETRNRHRDCLYTITGRGSHSHGGVARIKPAVEAYLKRNNYSYTESTPGVLKVRLHIGF